MGLRTASVGHAGCDVYGDFLAKTLHVGAQLGLSGLFSCRYCYLLSVARSLFQRKEGKCLVIKVVYARLVSVMWRVWQGRCFAEVGIQAQDLQEAVIGPGLWC